MEHKYLKYKEKYLSLKKQMGGMIHNLSSGEYFQNTIPDEDNAFALFNINQYPIHYDISKNPQRKLAAVGGNNIVSFELANPNTSFHNFNGYQFSWKPLTTTVYNIETIVPNYFTSTVLAMVLGLNYNKVSLHNFIAHKRVILFDFANIVGQIFMLLDEKLGTGREDEKIEFIIKTFLNFFNDNENCLYIIVAKPIRNISIDNIMLEYFSRNPTMDRDYFTTKCIVLTTTYFDGVSSVELPITGGSDDYILWLLTISLYNITKASFGDLKLITADKQKILKDLYFPVRSRNLSDRRAMKTILSNTFPTQDDVDRHNRNNGTAYIRDNIRIGIYFKNINFGTAYSPPSITTTVDQPAIDYLNIIWYLMKRELVLISSKGPVPMSIFELPPEDIYPIMETSENHFNNEINNIIKKHLAEPPSKPLYYTKYTDNLLPICKPQHASTGGTFIMLNTLKMIYYIRLVQVFLFGDVESALDSNYIYDVFQIYYIDSENDRQGRPYPVSKFVIGRPNSPLAPIVWDTRYTLI